MAKMDISSWSYQILHIDSLQTLLICLIIFGSLSWYAMKSNKTSLPGPFCWPIIRNMPTMIISSLYYKEQGHELMTRLNKKYGKIFTLDIGIGGSNSLVVLNDVKLIKEAFQRPELSYRPPLNQKADGPMGDIMRGRDLQHGGEAWTHHRRFSLSFFRGFGVGKSSFDEQMVEEATLLCEALRQSSGKALDPRTLLMNATSNLICSIVLGKHFGYEDQEFHQMLNAIDKRMQIIGSGSLWLRIPLLRKLYSSTVKELSECFGSTISYLRKVVDDHKKCLPENPDDCKDLIDLYLKEMEQKSEKSVHLTEEKLVFFIDGLFVAGTETSSNTLAWCLLHLIDDLDAQKRIRDEIRTACGDGQLPMYSNRSLLPFTESFILEVERCHTVIPLGGPHYAVKDSSLQGYTIPKGSVVIANLWGLHTDPDVWDNPQEFNPARFLDQSGKVVNREELMPFSTGRRVCLGEKLAKMEIFVFLIHLVRRFSFTKDGTSPVSFAGRNGVTYGPKPFQICINEIE